MLPSPRSTRAAGTTAPARIAPRWRIAQKISLSVRDVNSPQQIHTTQAMTMNARRPSSCVDRLRPDLVWHRQVAWHRPDQGQDRRHAGDDGQQQQRRCEAREDLPPAAGPRMSTHRCPRSTPTCKIAVAVRVIVKLTPLIGPRPVTSTVTAMTAGPTIFTVPLTPALAR